MTAPTDMRGSNGVARLRGGGIACPLPIDDRAVVQMAHGGGGTKTAEIIEGMLLPALTEAAVAATPGQNCRVEVGELSDGAIVRVGDERLAFSTDSFVVSPRFFPGGDIGSLAVHGTVNDLAMCGAVPLTLSLALVLEEGLEMAELQRIVDSIAAASAAVGVPVTTGDTKVVDRGKGDGVYINTTGIGRITAPVDLSPSNCRPGDTILVSGPIGDHGVAIMAARGGLHLDTDIVSDSASVVDLAMAVLAAAPNTRVLRGIERAGIRAIPITTGTACHLDAEMIHRALHAHAGPECHYVFVENVGNLVCPAIYDLGQNANVVAISVTEGEDKPLKYPVMFRHADLVLLTKTDLLPALPDFDLAAFESALAQVMPAPRVIRVSARTGDGIDQWVAWLDELHVGSETREHDHHHHAGDGPTPRKEGAAHA